MDRHLTDLAAAAEARLLHGQYAAQSLVDTIQRSIRLGDESAALAASRTLQLIQSTISKNRSSEGANAMKVTAPAPASPDRRGIDRRVADTPEYTGEDRRKGERRGERSKGDKR